MIAGEGGASRRTPHFYGAHFPSPSPGGRRLPGGYLRPQRREGMRAMPPQAREFVPGMEQLELSDEPEVEAAVVRAAGFLPEVVGADGDVVVGGRVHVDPAKGS